MYLLRCADGSLYTGWTVDLERRLARHRAGSASRYTASRLPVELALAISMPDRTTARREEARIKRLPRAAKLALLRRYWLLMERNVLGGPLESCSVEPVTGFYRDGCCRTGPGDLGSHTICAVVSAEFLDYQQSIGNDLSTPVPQYDFPGLRPGDRWCVTAQNWLLAHEDGVAAFVVLAATHERALEIVPLGVLAEYAVDVPADPGSIGA